MLARLDEIDDGGLGLVEADADDLEAGVVIGAIGRLEPGQLGDAGRAPGRPEIDQDVLAAVGVEADGLSLDVLGRERRRGLADLVQPLQLGLDLLAQVRALAEPREQRRVDLAGDRELAGGDRRGGEISEKLAANSSCSFWPSP